MPRTDPHDRAREPLLAWQRRLYDGNHRDRRNLWVHVATVPLFHAGLLAALAAPWLRRADLAVVGALAMIGAVAAQGRTHRLEETPPVPFAGPFDVLARIFAEQLVTFPRFVLDGGLGRALRGNGTGEVVEGPTSTPGAPAEGVEKPAPNV